MADPLERYNSKRDFAKTAEPAGGDERLPWGEGRAFMVQKHDATRLHYDLRLELDGTLKSWAVTRGPSADPADKRLAVRTEDHPLGYATFEGTIPKGQYGGGTVMLWDYGTWVPDPRKDPSKTLGEGHLHFTLEGERMKGEWIMIRLKPRGREKNENWILRKIDDEHAGSSGGLVDQYLTSVKTGRTMDEIAAGKKAKELKSWTKAMDGSSSSDPPSPRKRRPSSGAVAQEKAGRLGSRFRRNDGKGEQVQRRRGRAMLPAFREPQLATLAEAVPAGSGWIHEMKFDGYRCLLSIGGGEAKVFTRSGLDWSDKFPEIVAAARSLEVGSALLDGEIVKLDDAGKSNFSALQQAISEGGRGLTLFLFDALHIEDEDLTSLPNIERKQRLASLLGDGRPPLLYADHIVGAGEKLFEAMCQAGGEGIVSKKADAPYRNTRSKSWLKVKCTQRQEFVIIGLSQSDKAGRDFRALLLGLNEDGNLRYAGKVGTGFSNAVQQDLRERLEKLAVEQPAAPVPKAEARGAHWVKPSLVAEVAFAEFTAENVVRHASFLGLRGDKPAREVVVEKPAPLPAPADDAVKISNPERVVFPEDGITKGELAAYYRAVAPLMLPWSANRPISLVRCPQGRAKKCFFQKHDAGTFGDHVLHVPIPEKNGGSEDYIYFADQAGILSCVQMGTIEFHGWGSKVEDVEKPDRLVFDLDPDEGLGFDAVKQAARDLKQHLADLGLQTFPLLTGGKGLHVVAPLTPRAEWPAVKDFAHRFCVALATAEPDRFTANMAKAKRTGRIFLDYLRNQRGATAIMPYSARAREGAPVSALITWDELDETTGGNRFTVRDADRLIERASSRTLQGWGEAAQTLPEV